MGLVGSAVADFLAADEGTYDGGDVDIPNAAGEAPQSMTSSPSASSSSSTHFSLPAIIAAVVACTVFVAFTVQMFMRWRRRKDSPYMPIPGSHFASEDKEPLMAGSPYGSSMRYMDPDNEDDDDNGVLFL